MEQLLLHLIGDYVTQTQWMADNKTRNHAAALVHATVYSLPFLLLTQSPAALLTIFGTHFFIDRFRLARFVIFAKNWLTTPSLQWNDCRETGYPASMPPGLRTALLIVVDNTLHLCINYAAIRWL